MKNSINSANALTIYKPYRTDRTVVKRPQNILVTYFLKIQGLYKKFGLAMVLQRALIFLGPLRGLLIFYHKTCSRNELQAYYPASPFNAIDKNAICTGLKRDGYSKGINLNENQIEQIVDFTRNNPIKVGEKEVRIEPTEKESPINGLTTFTYHNPHLNCNEIENIARDPKILEVVKGYLGVDPILHSSRLYWSFAKTDINGAIKPQNDKKLFHFDVGDSKSVSLFFYLTDVDENAGPHAVIEGTHGHRSLFQIRHLKLSDQLAKDTYGSRIKAITGLKGTGFFEDLFVYHKHSWPKENKARLLLTFSYVIQRKPSLQCYTEAA